MAPRLEEQEAVLRELRQLTEQFATLLLQTNPRKSVLKTADRIFALWERFYEEEDVPPRTVYSLGNMAWDTSFADNGNLIFTPTKRERYEHLISYSVNVAPLREAFKHGQGVKVCLNGTCDLHLSYADLSQLALDVRANWEQNSDLWW